MKTSVIGRLAVIALSVLALPAISSAQSTIAGVVTDTSGAVIPGVTVEASSPVLIEKARMVVTNADGRYSIVDLRPGPYSLTFSLTGFTTVRREAVDVQSNVTVPINVEMRLGALEETITVSGATPVVDVQQAARRQVISRELLDALPTSRTLGAAGIVVPGVKLTKPDMGGIASFSQAYVQARGKGAEQNAFEVDGLDVRTIRGCPSTQYTNYALAQEVSVQTSANSAETSGGGVRINLIPREGGNTFTGELYAGGMNNAWQSDNITPELRAKGLPTPDSVQYMIETAPAVGGPILKDKLWFFGSPRLLRVQLYPAGARYSDGRPGYNTTRTDSATGRLTWQAGPKHKIAGYLDYAWKGQSNVNTGNSGPGAEYGPGGIDWGTSTTRWPPGLYYIAYLKATSTFSSRLLLENGLSWQRYDSITGTPVADGIAKPVGAPEWYASAPRLDFVRGTLRVAPAGGISKFIQPAAVWSSALSYVTGSHTFKTGVQWKWGSVRTISEPGNAGLVQRYRNGVPDAVDVSSAPTDTRSVLDADLGVYLQDSWTFKRLTVSPGIRVEHFTGGVGATSMAAGRFLPAREVPESHPLPAFTTIGPRFSAVYDVFGDARTALKFSANRYNSTLAALAFSPYNPVGGGSDRRNWFDTDLTPGTNTPSGRVLPTNGDDIAQENEVGPSNNNRFGLAAPRRADPDLEREYNWDYSLSVQHQLFPNIGVVGAWYHTRFYNLQSLTNVLVERSDYAAFQVANPLNAGEMLTVYNLNRAKQGQVDNVARNSDVNRRFYNGFELSMQARLPGGGQLMGGWFAERLLNVVCDTNNPNELRFCDETGKLHQDLGAVPRQPFRHEFKVAGSQRVPGGVQVGVSLASFPGGTGTFNGRSLRVNWAVPVNLFPGGRTEPVTVNLVPPGIKWLERWNQLDLNFKRPFRIGRFRFEPGVDVFNVLNASNVITELEAFGPSLGFPTSTLQGRFVKLGLMFRF